jgi:hypothetical protein
MKAKAEKTAVVLAKQRKRKDANEQSLFVSDFDSGNGNGDNATGSLEKEKVDIDNATVSKEDTRIAVQILCDYLSEEMTKLFIALMGFTASEMQPSKKQETKRKADWELEMELEKETLAFAMPGGKVAGDSANASANPASSTHTKGAPGPAKKKAAPTNAQKLGKPVQGKASLMSFFGGKK